MLERPLPVRVSDWVWVVVEYDGDGPAIEYAPTASSADGEQRVSGDGGLSFDFLSVDLTLALEPVMSTDAGLRELSGRQVSGVAAEPMERAGLRLVRSPAVGVAEFGVAVGSSREARVVIYDVRGRRLRHLALPGARGGQGVIQWNGDDDAGKPVAAGVYFARLHGSPTDSPPLRFVYVR